MPQPLKRDRPRVESFAVPDRIDQGVLGIAILIELNMRERREVVRILTERGWTGEKIAVHLRCSDRAVFRWRAHLAHGEGCRWSHVC